MMPARWGRGRRTVSLALFFFLKEENWLLFKVIVSLALFFLNRSGRPWV
jgi:hypothetical protein